MTPPVDSRPTVRTALYGVVGWPIAHSRSPAMQNAAFAATGVDAVYLAFAVPPEALDRAVAGAAALGVRGLNVTVPHKETALALSRPDPLAARVGAVNTLVFDGDDRGAPPHGHNTDVHGVRAWVEEEGGPPGPRALILGAGGAARAVAVALVDAGLTVRLCARTARPVTVDGVALPVAPWTDLPSLLADTDLLVDATPRGLDPAAPPVDLDPLPAHALVLDCVVARSTALVDAARGRGLRAATGAGMLLHQGAAAFERWTGRPAPLETMRRALADSL